MARAPKRTPRTTRRSRKNPARRASRAVNQNQVGSGAVLPSGWPPEPTESDWAELIAELQKRGPRQVEDRLWCAGLHCRPVTTWIYDLEKYAVVTPLPTPRVPAPSVDRTFALDALFYLSMTPGNSFELTAQREAERRQAGGRDPLDGELFNVEATMEQRPDADSEQLYNHRWGLRQLFGRGWAVRSAQFVSGSQSPRLGDLELSGGNGQQPDLAAVKFRGQFDADQAPAAVREDPIGAVVLLRLRNGRKRRHVRNALAKVLGEHPHSAGCTMLLWAMQTDEKLCSIVIDEHAKTKEGRAMANGTAAANLESFYQQFDEFVQRLDPKRIPTVRKLMQAGDRKLQRERQKRQQEQQKLHAMHVEGLLGILAGRSMELTENQEQRLWDKPLSKLPPFKLALKAKSASDFARRAGLTNGRK